MHVSVDVIATGEEVFDVYRDDVCCVGCTLDEAILIASRVEVTHLCWKWFNDEYRIPEDVIANGKAQGKTWRPCDCLVPKGPHCHGIEDDDGEDE